MPNQKIFCNAPWYELQIYWDGTLGFCCQESHKIYLESQESEYNVKNMSIRQWMDSPPMRAARVKMLNNNPVSFCSRCYNEESVGTSSRRHRSNQKSVIFTRVNFHESYQQSPGWKKFEHSRTNAGIEQYGIPNDIMSLGPHEIWDRCFLNVVTETVFDVDQIGFVSEKIYKPVVGMRPFLVYAPNGARAWLDRTGIENFTQDFRDISDHDPADPDQMTLFLRDLCAQDQKYWKHKYANLISKLRYNFNKFQAYIFGQKKNIEEGYTT